MKKFSEEAFYRDVASIDWEQALGFSGDANLLVQQFSNVFSKVIEKHAPLHQIHVSEIYCPWINSDIKNLIRTRDRLKRSAVKHKSQHLMNSYKQYKNQAIALNKALKCNLSIYRSAVSIRTWATMERHSSLFFILLLTCTSVHLPSTISFIASRYFFLGLPLSFLPSIFPSYILIQILPFFRYVLQTLVTFYKY